MIKHLNLSLNDHIIQSPGLIASNMGDEKVMLSISNGKYYNLGEIGGVIWGLLEKPTQVKQIINQLTNEFDVNHEQCEDDVLAFFESLLNEKIIKIIEFEE